MEKINITKLIDRKIDNTLGKANSWLEWALVELSVQISDSSIYDRNADGEIIFGMECSINGQEVEFSRLLGTMCKAFDEQVEKRAKEIFEEKYRAVTDKLEEATDTYLDTLGINLEEWS
jgi:hypothetical protein